MKNLVAMAISASYKHTHTHTQFFKWHVQKILNSHCPCSCLTLSGKPLDPPCVSSYIPARNGYMESSNEAGLTVVCLVSQSMAHETGCSKVSLQIMLLGVLQMAAASS